MFRLVKKSYRSYKEGGFDLFFHRVVNYLDGILRNLTVFIPSFPMITIQSCKQKISTYDNKYVLDEGRSINITPTASDTVIEAGVHRGRDTATFAKLAKQVIAFEPSPRNYKKAEENLKSFDNVTLINEGLWSEPNHLEIQYGASRGGMMDS